MKRTGERQIRRIFFVVMLLLTAAFACSLCFGRYELNFARIFDAASMDRQVFVQLRLGRSLAALAAGFALGVAGHVYQAAFRNPLASPDVTGVASGACCGAAAAILLGGTAAVTAVSAFAGGMLSLLLVLGLTAVADRTSLTSMLLCGIVVNALFQATLMLLKFTADADHVLASIEFWLMGSFADVTLTRFLPVSVWIVAALAGVFLLHRPIEMLALEDDEAATLGVPVRRMRALALGLGTMLTGAVISLSGPVTFVGLLAPHIARLLTRSGRMRGMLLSGCIGGVLVLSADVLARMVTTAELPVSCVTSILGAAMLVVLVCRKGWTRDE